MTTNVCHRLRAVRRLNAITRLDRISVCAHPVTPVIRWLLASMSMNVNNNHAVQAHTARTCKAHTGASVRTNTYLVVQLMLVASERLSTWPVPGTTNARKMPAARTVLAGANLVIRPRELTASVCELSKLISRSIF